MKFEELKEFIYNNVNCTLFDNNYISTINNYKIIKQYIIGCYIFGFITYKQMQSLLNPIDEVINDLEIFGIRNKFLQF